MGELKIISHRGAKGLAPENTLAAFTKAMRYAVDMIEFDVRVSSDNVPVIHHNSTIEDVSGQKVVIDRTSLSELKEHKPDLATLKEVLETINGAVPLYIEIKSRVNTGPVIDELKHYKHAFIVGSFSQKILVDVRKALPEAELAVTDAWSGVRSRFRAEAVGARTISMNQRWLWRGFVKAVKRSGYQLYAYTVNNPKRARRLAGWGVDGIFTDYPDRFTKD